MKKFFLITFLFVVTFYIFPFQAKGTVKNATIYNDRAMITKLAKVNLKKGNFQFYINNISPKFDKDSIKVELKQSNIKIYDVYYKEIYLEKEQNSKISLYRNKIKTLEKSIALLQNKNEALKHQLDILKSIKAELEEISKKNFTKTTLNTENLSKSINFILQKYTNTLDSVYLNNNKIKDYNEKINYYQKLLSEIVSNRKVERRIYVEGYSYKTGVYNFYIKYLVYGVSWYPEYKVYLSNSKKNVKMEFYAKISQKTGEDWNNTILTFSTSMPYKGIVAPQIKPLYLSNLIRQGMILGVKAHKKLISRAMGSSEMVEDKINTIRYSGTNISENGYSVEYTTKKAYSIPSGTTQKSIYLQVKTLKGKIIYESVPMKAEKAYAKIETVNSGNTPILAGKISLFYGESYVGEYYIKNILPGEKIKLDLGPVNFFKIKYKLVRRIYTPASLFKKTVSLDFTYEIDIQNLSNNTQNLIFYHRIPVSNDSKIIIKNVSITPTNFEKDDKTGIIKWNIKFNPKQKIKAIIKYKVVYPKNYHLSI